MLWIIAIGVLGAGFFKLLQAIDKETGEAERARQARYAALPQYEKDRITADRIIQYNRTGK